MNKNKVRYIISHHVNKSNLTYAERTLLQLAREWLVMHAGLEFYAESQMYGQCNGCLGGNINADGGQVAREQLNDIDNDLYAY